MRILEGSCGYIETKCGVLMEDSLVMLSVGMALGVATWLLQWCYLLQDPSILK